MVRQLAMAVVRAHSCATVHFNGGSRACAFWFMATPTAGAISTTGRECVLPVGGRCPWRALTAAGQDVELIEECLPGRTTNVDDPQEGAWCNGLTPFEAILLSQQPLDRILIMLGTNDLKHRFGRDASTVTAGLMALVSIAAKQPPAPEGGTPRRDRRSVSSARPSLENAPMTRTGSGSMNGVEDEPCLQTFPAQWPPRQWPPVLASSMPTGLSSLRPRSDPLALRVACGLRRGHCR